LHYSEVNLRLTYFVLWPGIALLTALAACEPAAKAEPKPAVEQVAVEPRGCGDDGFLSATLFGAIEHSIDWDARQFDCENMTRPGGEGMRLRFTGVAADHAVSIILAIPDLERGLGGRELPTVITLAVEGSGRFFSTASLDSCFTDIDAPADLDGSASGYDIHGTLFCVSALGEINGDAAVSIPELRFQSRINWASQ
jgi:hypothetical protein